MRVLAKIAEHRQVIVFSHDNRFAAAVRRAEINAQVLEVTRESGSRVSVTNAFNPPSKRYLLDAGAMLRDERMPEDATRKVLPGLLRFAVEAQARDRFFADALGAGRGFLDVEKQWDAASTSQRVSLALYGEVRQLDGWLDKRAGRKLALGVCTSGAHAPLRGGDPMAAQAAVTQMVSDIAERVR